MSFKGPHQSFEDILHSILLIQRFVDGQDFDHFRGDDLTRSAVERQLMNLTEAAFRLGPDVDVLCPGPPWHSIRALGNRLRHAYDLLDYEVVWQVVCDHLPALKISVEAAVEKLPPEDDRD